MNDIEAIKKTSLAITFELSDADIVTEDEFKSSAIDYLKSRNDVAWVSRMNVGARGKVKFGFPGLSDIIGQKTSGIFFAIEAKKIIMQKKSVKRTEATSKQIEFIHSVIQGGGLAGIAVTLSCIDKILDGENKYEMLKLSC